MGTTKQMGQEGFIWWTGKVVDVKDPIKLGRAKVQIHNVHEGIDSEYLGWSFIITPTTSASYQGVGDTPQFIEGTTVFGFWMDGNSGRVPYIVGTMPVIPDMDDNKHSLSFLARGKNTINNKKLHPVEPDSAYKAEYPLNRVMQTRKGHVIELDDTDGAERVHIYHASGTSIEMAPNGRIIIRNPGDSFEIVGGVKNVAVNGDANIEVKGNLKARVKGSVSITSDKNISLSSGGRIDMFGTMGIGIRSGGGVVFEAPAGVSITEGSLHVVGRTSIGTGVTGTVVAGGKAISIRDGIITGLS